MYESTSMHCFKDTFLSHNNFRNKLSVYEFNDHNVHARTKVQLPRALMSFVCTQFTSNLELNN